MKQLEEKERRQTKPSETANPHYSAGFNEYKDHENLAKPPDIQKGKVNGPNEHDDDSDILITNLSDQEHAEMESWGN